MTRDAIEFCIEPGNPPIQRPIAIPECEPWGKQQWTTAYKRTAVSKCEFMFVVPDTFETACCT